LVELLQVGSLFQFNVFFFPCHPVHPPFSFSLLLFFVEKSLTRRTPSNKILAFLWRPLSSRVFLAGSFLLFLNEFLTDRRACSENVLALFLPSVLVFFSLLLSRDGRLFFELSDKCHVDPTPPPAGSPFLSYAFFPCHENQLCTPPPPPPPLCEFFFFFAPDFQHCSIPFANSVPVSFTSFEETISPSFDSSATSGPCPYFSGASPSSSSDRGACFPPLRCTGRSDPLKVCPPLLHKIMEFSLRNLLLSLTLLAGSLDHL